MTYTAGKGWHPLVDEGMARLNRTGVKRNGAGESVNSVARLARKYGKVNGPVG